MAKMVDCSLEVSKFKLRLHYYIHFQTNNFGKGMHSFIISTLGQIVPHLLLQEWLWHYATKQRNQTVYIYIYPHPSHIPWLIGGPYRIIPLNVISRGNGRILVVPISFPSNMWRVALGLKNKIQNYNAIGLMSKAFGNGLGDWGSIPGWVIPKTQKWYLMQPCLRLSIIR